MIYPLVGQTQNNRAPVVSTVFTAGVYTEYTGEDACKQKWYALPLD